MALTWTAWKSSARPDGTAAATPRDMAVEIRHRSCSSECNACVYLVVALAFIESMWQSPSCLWVQCRLPQGTLHHHRCLHGVFNALRVLLPRLGVITVLSKDSVFDMPPGLQDTIYFPSVVCIAMSMPSRSLVLRIDASWRWFCSSSVGLCGIAHLIALSRCLCVQTRDIMPLCDARAS